MPSPSCIMMQTKTYRLRHRPSPSCTLSLELVRSSKNSSTSVAAAATVHPSPLQVKSFSIHEHSNLQKKDLNQSTQIISKIANSPFTLHPLQKLLVGVTILDIFCMHGTHQGNTTKEPGTATWSPLLSISENTNTCNEHQTLCDIQT